MSSDENKPRPDSIQHKEIVKHKMKQIKRARNRGNYGKANRIAQELVQFAGFDDHETPIESELEE
jgi:hypothetical protein